jgi:hypothetical protein
LVAGALLHQILILEEVTGVILFLALLLPLAVVGVAQMQPHQEVQVVRAAVLEMTLFLEGLELLGRDTQVEIALARLQAQVAVAQVALDQIQQPAQIMRLVVQEGLVLHRQLLALQ